MNWPYSGQPIGMRVGRVSTSCALSVGHLLKVVDPATGGPLVSTSIEARGAALMGAGDMMGGVGQGRASGRAEVSVFVVRWFSEMQTLSQLCHGCHNKY